MSKITEYPAPVTPDAPLPAGVCHGMRRSPYLGASSRSSAAIRVYFLIRTQDDRHAGDGLVLSRPTNLLGNIVPLIRAHLDIVYRPTTLYRATGAVLSDLRGEGEAQLDLLGEVLRAARIRHVYAAVG